MKKKSDANGVEKVNNPAITLRLPDDLRHLLNIFRVNGKHRSDNVAVVQLMRAGLCASKSDAESDAESDAPHNLGDVMRRFKMLEQDVARLERITMHLDPHTAKLAHVKDEPSCTAQDTAIAIP